MGLRFYFPPYAVRALKHQTRCHPSALSRVCVLTRLSTRDGRAHAELLAAGAVDLSRAVPNSHDACHGSGAAALVSAR